MKKYVEKKMKKYIIATVDGKYLRRDVLNNEYYFVEDIEIATKTEKLSVANDVVRYFYQDTKMNVELVIIPVEITYELICETN